MLDVLPDPALTTEPNRAEQMRDRVELSAADAIEALDAAAQNLAQVVYACEQLGSETGAPPVEMVRFVELRADTEALMVRADHILQAFRPVKATSELTTSRQIAA